MDMKLQCNQYIYVKRIKKVHKSAVVRYAVGMHAT